MSHIYLTKSNVRVGYEHGCITVRENQSDASKEIPIEYVDGISVFGNAQLSTQLIRECISSNIQIGYYANDGHYFGHLTSSKQLNPLRQKEQIYLTDNEDFRLRISSKIISAKIHNSLQCLKSYKNVYSFSEDDIRGILHSYNNLKTAESINEIMGFEGNAAKSYFKCLSLLMDDEKMKFNKRTSRPPKDPFNSMISFGYSLLYRNVIGAIERHGLHPYFSFLHSLKSGHAALASDLVEEFRAPLVDKTVIDLVLSKEIDGDGFYENDQGAIYMKNVTAKKLTDSFSSVFAEGKQYYRAYGDKRLFGFQVLLDMKIKTLIDAIENRNYEKYKPFIWEP